MQTSQIIIKDVETYLSVQPESIRPLLENLRQIIKTIVPEAQEVISYQMPAFKQNGILVWYAGYKKHIGFYPSTKPIEIFRDELAAYKTSKGAIQFPLDKPLPVELITKIVNFKLNEDLAKILLKTKKNIILN